MAKPLNTFLATLAEYRETAAGRYRSLTDEDLLRGFQRGHDLAQLIALYHADSYIRRAGATRSADAISGFDMAWNDESYGMWQEIRNRGLERKIEQLRYQDLRDGRQPNNHFDKET